MRNVSMSLLQRVFFMNMMLAPTVSATFPSLTILNKLILNDEAVYNFPLLASVTESISSRKLLQNFPALVSIGASSITFTLNGLISSSIGLPVLKTIQSPLIDITTITVFSAPLLESAYSMTFTSSVNNILVPMLQNVTGALTILSLGNPFIGDFSSLQRVTVLFFSGSAGSYIMSTPSLVEILDSVQVNSEWQAPLLLRIGGAASISPSLVAPLLTTIGGILTFSTPSALNLPSLVSVYQTDLQLIPIINLPALTTVTNNLKLGGNTPNTTLPELTSVGGVLTIQVTTNPGTVVLPKLSRVFSIALTISAPNGTVLIPLLQDAGVVSITVDHGTFPNIALKNVQQLTITCPVCSSMPLGQLSVVTNSISITGLSTLTEGITINSLTYVGGDVTISACSGTSIATTMLEALVAIPDYGQYRTVSITCTSQTCDSTVSSCLAAKNTLIARGATVNVP